MSKITWVLTDGKKGTESQCLGVASFLGLNPIIKSIQPRFFWSFLPPRLWFTPLKGVRGLESETVWPDVLIAGGRSAAPVAREIRKITHGKTITIFLQNPNLPLQDFDLVIAPTHDRLSGENLIETLGCFNSVTSERLKQAYKSYDKLFRQENLKNVAVLLGGKTRHYKMPSALLGEYGCQLRSLANRQPFNYLVTASRRTDASGLEAFKKGLGNSPHFIWDGKGDNPYMGILAHADVILVTMDSVSMISEAIMTGKPIYLLPLKGNSRRIDRFHKELLEKGIARIFEGKLETWTYEIPLQAQKLIKPMKKLGLLS